jgi:hypothetical protein
MAVSKYPSIPARPPGSPTSSKMPAAIKEPNDTGPQMLIGGRMYYRQVDDLALTICISKTITDEQWIDFLENTLRLAKQIGRMPKVTMASFLHTYPDAKQRRLTRDFLASQGVKPIDRLGLLSDNPLVRGAIVAFSWVVPNANVLAFGSRDVATCLEWLHQVAIFDERRASTAWSEGRAALRVH